MKSQRSIALPSNCFAMLIDWKVTVRMMIMVVVLNEMIVQHVVPIEQEADCTKKDTKHCCLRSCSVSFLIRQANKEQRSTLRANCISFHFRSNVTYTKVVQPNSCTVRLVSILNHKFRNKNNSSDKLVDHLDA